MAEHGGEFWGTRFSVDEILGPRGFGISPTGMCTPRRFLLHSPAYGGV